MKATVTKADLRAAIEIMRTVAEAIREVGEIPSCHLYAQLMGHMSLDTYRRVIFALTQAGLVSERNHLLRWIGPAKEEQA